MRVLLTPPYCSMPFLHILLLTSTVVLYSIHISSSGIMVFLLLLVNFF